MPFRIDYVEELGSQRLVHGLVGDRPMVAAVSSEIPLPETASLSIAPSRLHFFDTASGHRIDWAGAERSPAASVAGLEVAAS